MTHVRGEAAASSPSAMGPAEGARRSRPVTIGMALYGDVTFDSRVRREAASLAAAGYAVRLVCLGSGGARDDLPAAVEVIVRRPTTSAILPGAAGAAVRQRRDRLDMIGRAVARLRWLIGYGRNLRAWGRSAVVAAGRVEAWHAHDLPALIAIAPHLGAGFPLVYDSHELFLDAGTAGRLPGPLRAILRRYEARLVRRASAVVTVNAELARVIGERYHPGAVVVVHNCPPRWTPTAGPDVLRAAAGIDPGRRVILYHGSIGPERGIETLFEAIRDAALADVHLVILGPGEQRDAYEALAADPAFGGRAHVLPGVPPAELLDWVNRADVSGVLIGRSTVNHLLSTPNKLFESLAAGVPVVASDFPAMRPIVMGDPAGPLGAVVDPSDRNAVVAGLRSILSLSPDARASLRERCRTAARERWNWETESSRLISLYGRLVASDSGVDAR